MAPSVTLIAVQSSVNSAVAYTKQMRISYVRLGKDGTRQAVLLLLLQDCAPSSAALHSICCLRSVAGVTAKVAYLGSAAAALSQ